METVKSKAQQSEPVDTSPETNSANTAAEVREVREVLAWEADYFQAMFLEAQHQRDMAMKLRNEATAELRERMIVFITDNFGEKLIHWHGMEFGHRLYFYRDVMRTIFPNPIPEDDDYPF